MAIRHAEWTDAIRPTAPGQAFVAIGDVHGRADLLAELHEALVKALHAIPARDVTCIHLGDLIDKGSESRRALQLARQGLPGATNHTLLGNHEDRMLQLLEKDDEPTFLRWLDKGGREFFDELGVAPGPGWQAGFRDALGSDLLAWLSTCPTMLRFPQFVFVHAGIRPTKPLSEQTVRDLLWIRDPWTRSTGPYEDGLAVIHGHSPFGHVDLANRHRINLDTGAVNTGILSSLLIFEDRMKLLSTAAE